jgi:hypothetical protein
MIAAEFAASLGQARPDGEGWRCCCPLCGQVSLRLQDNPASGRVRFAKSCLCDRDAIAQELRDRAPQGHPMRTPSQGRLAATFAVTFFDDYAARSKREESLDIEALATRIKHTTAPRKNLLPWLKLARFGPLPSPNGNSGSLRWNGNILRFSGAVADYDKEQITPEEAAERASKAGIITLVYPTPSHMVDGHGPRWRLVCPFRREQDRNGHYQMIARLNGLFGGDLAPESFTDSQCYYFGAVDGNPGGRVILVDGTVFLDEADELDKSAIGKPNGNSLGASPAGNPEADIEDIRSALAAMGNPLPSWTPAPAPSWVEWNNVGMAIWRASGGSEEGFKAFDDWSTRSPKHNAEETEFRWRHYSKSPPTRIGFGSLVHMAREVKSDWTPPSRKRRIWEKVQEPPPEDEPTGWEEPQADAEPWPDMDAEAFCGLAGEITFALAPLTEADPVAILAQFLAAFGSAFGRGAYYSVGPTKHYPAVFVIIAGNTAKARKGTAWDSIEGILRMVDQAWAASCVRAGLSSGEGIIHHAHDGIWVREKVNQGKGQPPTYERVLKEPAVADKRLFFIEQELASALAAMKRHGNTLSPTLRNA